MTNENENNETENCAYLLRVYLVQKPDGRTEDEEDARTFHPSRAAWRYHTISGHKYVSSVCGGMERLFVRVRFVLRLVEIVMIVD